MAKKERNIFKQLSRVVIGASNGSLNTVQGRDVLFDPTIDKDHVLYTTNNEDDFLRKKEELKQRKLLARQWLKTGYETSLQQAAGANAIRIMYRDAELMDQWPEINAALHIVAEEATTLGPNGDMLTVRSSSDRIQSTLTNLFNNILDIKVFLPMIARATCKYGNEFMLLNLDPKYGVTGWRELPVSEIRRIEGGINGTPTASHASYASGIQQIHPDEVLFTWEGHTEPNIPFTNYQIAHFRLTKDSLFLPYGTSWLNGARRHWRMLSMMEDAMLIYRLERSIERRIFKVNVGAIDDADIPAFLQEFMNKVKRAPIYDPQTGQIDLRKNFLDVSADYVIPVRPGQDPSTIENLQSAQSQTTMDDINYMENKVLSQLRVPKSYLNFQEPQGKGQNLSILDIRFNRTVNSIQQALLMELNKVAIIHLALLGFPETEYTNFTLSLNNPSNQIELMELDNLTKRLSAAATALAEQPGGIPLMSWKDVQTQILGKSDSEVGELLNQLRIEKALADELANTNQIIKHTGFFDRADRIYGEPEASYGDGGGNNEGPGGPMGGPPMGGGPGLDFGGGLDSMGDDDFAPVGGEEGGADLGDMGGDMPDAGGPPPPMNEVYNSLHPKNVELLDSAYHMNSQLNHTVTKIQQFLNNNSKLLENINEELSDNLGVLLEDELTETENVTEE